VSRRQSRAAQASQRKQAKTLSKLYMEIVVLLEKIYPGRHPEVRVYQANSYERRVAATIDPPKDAGIEVPEGHEARSNILEVVVLHSVEDATKLLLKKVRALVASRTKYVSIGEDKNDVMTE